MKEMKTLDIGDGPRKIVDGDAVRSFYSTTREELGVAPASVNTAYIFGLYDALMAKYPDRVQKNEIHNNDGSFTNYEYVISTGEYNTAGIRGVRDTHIEKPKYLVLSGIHGYEKNAIISTYRFIRDVLSGHNIPPRFREGAVIRVVPMGTPSGVDLSQRTNDNGVNINRNFDWEWEEVGNGTTNYSGASVASEKETQAIVNWLKANRDAELFIDRHDSGNINEVAMLVGLQDVISDATKKTALRGLDGVIPHWRDVIGYTAHKGADASLGMQDPVFAYSAFVDAIGGAIYYARDVLGIPSLSLETTALANEDYPANGNYLFKPETIAAGAESLGNILLEFYEQYLSNECVNGEGFTEEDKADIVNAVLVALMSTPNDSFAYYGTLVAAVNDVNAGTIGTNADADRSTAVAGVYVNEGQPYVVLLKDTTEAARVQPKVPMTINLNGHTLVNTDVIGIDIKSDDVVVDGRLDGSGVYVENTLATARAIQVGSGYKNAIINGGLYTAINPSNSPTSIYVGSGSTASISNCELNSTAGTKVGYGVGVQGEATISGCAINAAATGANAIGVNLSGNMNVTVYMDNCDISGTALEVVAMQLETAGVQSAMYVSNTNILEGSVINIASDVQKLYIGRGNNFTAADTTRPSAVITTNEVYAQVG